MGEGVEKEQVEAEAKVVAVVEVEAAAAAAVVVVAVVVEEEGVVVDEEGEEEQEAEEQHSECTGKEYAIKPASSTAPASMDEGVGGAKAAQIRGTRTFISDGLP